MTMTVPFRQQIRALELRYQSAEDRSSRPIWEACKHALRLLRPQASRVCRITGEVISGLTGPLSPEVRSIIRGLDREEIRLSQEIRTWEFRLLGTYAGEYYGEGEAI